MSVRDLSPEERRERGTELCRRLAADVALVAPPGIGRWDRAWEITASADSAFMVALTAWEAEPGEALRLRVRDAYREVVAAWKRAAEEFEAERSTPREEDR